MIVAIITTTTIIIMIEALTNGLLDEITRHSSRTPVFPKSLPGVKVEALALFDSKQNGMPIEQSKYSVED